MYVSGAVLEVVSAILTARPTLETASHRARSVVGFVFASLSRVTVAVEAPMMSGFVTCVLTE
jgi:hypothetical protein